jgi:pimeloyl-ACP methyl ester carboxylesterase
MTLGSAHGSRARKLTIVILHPSSPVVDAWQPVQLDLQDRGVSCEVITWPGWVGDLTWKRGKILSALRADALAKLRPLAAGSGLVLVGHHVGARLARMLAGELDATAVVELSEPSHLSLVMRLGSSRPVGWILAALVFALPNGLRGWLAGHAYRRLTFAGDPPVADLRAFVGAARVRRQAVELVRRGTALLAELDRSPEPPIVRPTLSLHPTAGRVTTASGNVSQAVTLEVPGGHSAHVEHPELLAALIAEWCQLLTEAPAGRLDEMPGISERLGGCLAAERRQEKDEL